MTPAEKLVAIRKSLGWTQAQMAGTLGLDRSYLSLLESGARPASDAIVNRAVGIMDEARRLAPPADLATLRAQLAELSTDTLVSIYEYVVERRNSAPPSVQPFYVFISGLLMRELAGRLDLDFHRERLNKRRARQRSR